ncbi:DUF3710 domain-containing protein [Nocardia seriolae]|uniref:Uncharacterized protein n=1 Tax=Nocardia seriolae TaxID=37332 RepID=A0A0B8NES5_9NOCA|nr:DUF3710 domain-containing protein [Nocardia seriolae]APA99906.1 hypothetical protein NS506_05870 [Nocardia seriolae]MTJ64594.1 DUF3710 domain-containing protein [Nocardia seriolae]MTJ72137.1 DUF3710 domain-containing protein [Nocardia seriolae]MTJ89437.1 DUF3710 domain-containing protein [Nocardia seriolae]MTK33413.1 DUF3710 domain-containing protein [Nocardia seriolae]
MAFGRKKNKDDRADAPQYEGEYDEYEEYDESAYEADEYDEPEFDDEPVPARGEQTGPFDYEDVADRLEAIAEQRLDLGSVIVPVPPGGQLQVEMTPDGTPQAVHLATQHGRITVAAYAAPKTSGQWRSVAADLAETLRKDGATVSVVQGPWGRELHAVTQGADLRFIGVDGYRWMVRLVAAGPTGAADDNSPLVAAARAVLGETVVRRGDEPLPVREPLPVVLPQELADQLAAAHQQQLAAQQQAMQAQMAAMQGGPAFQPEQPPTEPRRGAEGSAMQQLGLN